MLNAIRSIHLLGVRRGRFAFLRFRVRCRMHGVNVGTAQTADVTFAGLASDACVISNNNAQAGPDGDTSGFDPAPFGTGWSLLGKLTARSGSSSLDGVNFTWGFTGTGTGPGTWTLTGRSERDAGPRVRDACRRATRGAFLFDDRLLAPGQRGLGRSIGSTTAARHPHFSNLTLFARDITAAVPEPETYALMLAGLGVMGFIARRRRPA